MLNLLQILIFLVLGLSLQRILKSPDKLAAWLNQLLISVILPALALRYLPRVELSLHLLLPVSVAYISFFLSWLLFSQVGKWRGWSRSVTGSLIITSGLANTSFVGIPVLQALYGSDAVKIALLIDQAGSFILVSTLAIIVASIYAAGKKRKRDIAGKILRFPPFIFFNLALALNLVGWSATGWIDELFGWIALALTPVALTAVGLQIKINLEAISNRFLWYGLGYKLVLIPLIIWIVFGPILGVEGLLLKVSVMEMAMAPMITGSIIAISHDLEPKLASLLVGIGIPLSFLTLGGWYYFLELGW